MLKSIIMKLLGKKEEKKEKAPTLRVLVEGGFQDDWYQSLHIDNGRYVIPKETTQLQIYRHGEYKTLDLFGRLHDDGKFEEQLPTTDKPVAVKIDYDTANNINCVATILVEDGRVYHDQKLRFSEDCINDLRMKAFLIGVVGEGGFNKVFEKKPITYVNQPSIGMSMK